MQCKSPCHFQNCVAARKYGEDDAVIYYNGFYLFGLEATDVMKMYPIMIGGAVGIGKALYHRMDAIVVIADMQEVQAK